MKSSFSRIETGRSEGSGWSLMGRLLAWSMRNSSAGPKHRRRALRRNRPDSPQHAPRRDLIQVQGA